MRFSTLEHQHLLQEILGNVDLSKFVEELLKAVSNQVYITTKFVEITQTNTDELGFDWLLGQFNAPGSNRIFGGGGSVGNQRGGAVNSMTTHLFLLAAEQLNTNWKVSSYFRSEIWT